MFAAAYDRARFPSDGTMLSILSAVVFLILLISMPAVCTAGAAKGLALWYQQVLPALFPAMIAASFLISRRRIQQLLARLPHPAIAVFFSGVLCGSPMGALTCNSLCQTKLLSPKEGRRMLALVQLPSPLFLFGFTASGCLNLPSLPAFAVSAYLPPCIFFTLFLCFSRNRKQKEAAPAGCTADAQPALSEICDHSFALLIRIGILLMFFSIISELLTMTTAHLPAAAIWPDLFMGMLEMTTGVSRIAACLLPVREKTVLCLFLTGYGGLCVHIQVRQAWQDASFPWVSYELLRIGEGICSGLLYLLLTS